MYESYFQFQSPPFPAIPVVSNYFPAESIESARVSLVRLIERAEGPGLVIGQAGMGKSLLLRLLSEHFASQFRIVLLSGARIVTRKALIQHILFELGLPFRGMDEGELRLALIDTLRPTDATPSGILLLVDEAHTLPLRLLDEMRMITNVVRDGQPRVRLVLAGDPRLEERFAHPKLESFNQRIAARCYLQPLTRDETHEYVRAELSWVGGDPDAIFSEDAIRAVHQATDGIPRLVNQICDHALVMAQSTGMRQIDATQVQAAWSDLQQLPPPWQPLAGESPTSKSTVIEFGQLDDVDLPTGRHPDLEIAEPGAPMSFDEAHPIPSEFDSIAAVEYQVEPLLVSEPTLDGPAQWIECGAAVAAVPETKSPETKAPDTKAPEPKLQTVDPFEDEFEEEVVVIDRHAVNEIEAFRGRPRVTCSDSHEISTGLKQHFQQHAPVQLTDEVASVAVPGLVDGMGAFEFTTLQSTPAPADAKTGDGSESRTDLESGVPEVNGWESDDDVHCVPLPWTRGMLGDDRDLIIIEDDAPEMHLAHAVDQLSESARQVEYRELFSQLRRAAP